MDMLQVFHMNKGEGDASYAKNSAVQSNILSMTKPFVEEAMQKFLDNEIPDTIAIADLGCSSGPTALKAVSEIMEAVKCKWRQAGRAGPGSGSPKFMVFLNDLPGNDFNSVFASISNFQKKWKEEKGGDFGQCFIAGLPATFHGRLLPNNTLHFVHSSSSLHWLSQVPPGLDGKDDNPKMVNKGKICVSITSPSEVINAYKLQFQNDFLSFLRYRSYEVISGGRMVLTLMGRRFNNFATEEDCYPWEFIAQSLMSMVSEGKAVHATYGAQVVCLGQVPVPGTGLIEERMVDYFNAPYYAPCLEEVKQLIEKESSFSRDRLVALEVDWDGGNENDDDYDEFASSYNCTPLTRGEKIAKMHRAVSESMLGHYFGEDMLDELFNRYARILDQKLIVNPNAKIINLVISLIRK
ncbi:Jasmonate O-methyltransferase [Bienertia sinuspersici]